MPPIMTMHSYAAPMDMCRLTPRSLQMDMSIQSKSFSGNAGKEFTWRPNSLRSPISSPALTFRQKKIWPRKMRDTLYRLIYILAAGTQQELTEDDVKAKVSWVVKKAERLGLSMDDETARDHLTEAITVANRSTKK